MFDRRNEAVGGLAALMVGAAVVLGAPTVLPGATADPSDPASDAVSSDEYGYLDSSARCDDDQTLMAFGRTSRAMVAVCVDPDGELEYRGVRVSDQAATAMSASRASDGTVIATNNGVTYALSPAMLLVSEGDNVLYRDPWIEFRQPRFSAAPVTPSATPSATRPQAPTSTSSTPPTVSTTTVTMPPVTTRPGW
ncbi:MAG: hypothetical protein NWR02_05715 [Mycobacterium sp.]|jgi:hypothetical protein|nr:hypothetical protein [Mycobacterium sp.]